MTADELAQERMENILAALAPHAILVGSAAYGDEYYHDIDLVVSGKGLAIGRKIFPPSWESVFPMSMTTYKTPTPIEIFRVWYGPDYNSLSRRKRELTRVTIAGVEFRAWPYDMREEEEA